jgi:hypothetical protein
MIAKGVSAIVAVVVILFGMALLQPAQPIRSAQTLDTSAQLAAANVGNVGSTGGASSGSACPVSDKTTPGTQTADQECKTTSPNQIVSENAPKGNFSCQNKTITNLYGNPCSQTQNGYTETGKCVGPQTCCIRTFQMEGGQEKTVANCNASTFENAAAQTSPPNDAGLKGAGTSQPPVPDTKGAAAVASGNTGASAVGASSGGTATNVGNAASGAAPGNGGVASAGVGINGSAPTAGGTFSATPPSAGTTPPPAQTFTTTPNLNNVTMAQPTSAQNPFEPVSQGTGIPTTGPYTPTQPTFGSGVPQSFSSISSSRSPLTNFVASIGNIGSIFGYISSILAPAPSPTPTANTVTGNQVTQIIVETNPTAPASGQTSAQVSLDNPLATAISPVSPQAQQQNYQSLLDLLTGGQPAATPSEIVSVLEGTNNPTQSLVTVNSSANTQVEQEIPPAVALDSAINSQIPEITSLALDTTNGLENSQPVPEQFYSDEASLAQAQSNYAWLQAQVAAWQNAESAGVCDNACENALSLLQSEVPDQFQQVQQLQAIVDAGPTPLEATTSTSTASEIPTITTQVPGAGESNVVVSQTSALQTPVPAEGAPFYIEQNNEWCDQYGQCIPQSSFESAPITPSATVTAGFAATNPTQQPENLTAADPIAAITQTVGGWVDDIISLFTPSVSTTTAQVQSCSLFKSLFGGCQGY